MSERLREAGPDEAGPALQVGALAVIEGEGFELLILVASGGRMALCADRPALPLSRAVAAALLDALVAARLWAAVGSEGATPIDVESRIESVELPPEPVDPMAMLEAAESFGVFATERGPDAMIGLVLREPETPLDPRTIEAMIARLTSAWLWLWGRGGD